MFFHRTVVVTIFLLVGFSASGLSVHAQSVGGDKPAAKKDQIKVAAVQISGYDKGDLPREGYDPVSLLLPYIDRAGKDGADLVVFPEYVLGHIPVPGDVTKRISAAAAANKIYVIVGCWENLSDGEFANSALLFDRTGRIAGRYKKTHAAIDHFGGDVPWQRPPDGKSRHWMKQNDPEWIMQPGEDLPVFELDFGRIGILTCYDGWFPEPARVLSLRGAELVVWINGRGGTVEDFIVRSTMFQSHVAMVTANQAYGGGTMIGDPTHRGHIVARCPIKKESYVSATINLKSIRRIRSKSRNFAQRRPDLYDELTVPTSTRSANESASR